MSEIEKTVIEDEVNSDVEIETTEKKLISKPVEKNKMKTALHVAIVLMTYTVALGILVWAAYLNGEASLIRKKIELMSEQNEFYKDAKPLEAGE